MTQDRVDMQANTEQVLPSEIPMIPLVPTKNSTLSIMRAQHEATLRRTVR